MSELKNKKPLKYQALVDRGKELINMYNQDPTSSKPLWEDDCIINLFECEGILTYETIAKFCKERNIDRVVDIGCAYGHQSEAFRIEGVDYLGVNENKVEPFFNKDKFEYIVGHYPMELPLKDGDLGISVLCLTWNVYLYEKEKTLSEQCQALQKDFEHCLLYLQPSTFDEVSKYFKQSEKIQEKLYYFRN